MLSPFGSFLFSSAFEKVLPLQSCKTFSAQNSISLRHLKKLMRCMFLQSASPISRTPFLKTQQPTTVNKILQEENVMQNANIPGCEDRNLDG